MEKEILPPLSLTPVGIKQKAGSGECLDHWPCGLPAFGNVAAVHENAVMF